MEKDTEDKGFHKIAPTLAYPVNRSRTVSKTSLYSLKR
jgi:hypothetical protein